MFFVGVSVVASGGYSRALEADDVLGVGLCVVVNGIHLRFGQTVDTRVEPEF